MFDRYITQETRFGLCVCVDLSKQVHNVSRSPPPPVHGENVFLTGLSTDALLNASLPFGDRLAYQSKANIANVALAISMEDYITSIAVCTKQLASVSVVRQYLCDLQFFPNYQCQFEYKSIYFFSLFRKDIIVAQIRVFFPFSMVFSWDDTHTHTLLVVIANSQSFYAALGIFFYILPCNKHMSQNIQQMNRWKRIYLNIPSIACMGIWEKRALSALRHNPIAL